MWIFNFWIFRVLGFIATILLFLKIGEDSNLKLGNFGGILAAFALPLIALFWINYPNFYLKYIYRENGKQTKKRKKKRKKKA